MPHHLTRLGWTAFATTRRLCRLSVCSHFVNKRTNATSATSSSEKNVRIGCASGFWGDATYSVPQLLHGGNLDYLVFDYLSEITMSLLAAAKQKTPDGGYPQDFVQFAIAPHIRAIKEKGVKVISNAGGVNPQACTAALKKVCEEHKIHLNIATVTGDDLMPQLGRLKKRGVKEMYSGAEFPEDVTSMTAYLGAGPISRALELGADIVVTGRCVDSALVLAPLLYEMQWKPDEFDKLAAGSLAGHLVECGAQVTGGIFTDWYEVPDWANIGFPIVECSSNGDFIVTKPPNTGGLVSKATVSEQLLYEIGDPKQYILPDVVCDFSNVELTEVEGKSGEAVFVSGARGKPPTPDYKVSATYRDGYRVTAVACVGGPRSKEKAKRTANEILKRCRRICQKMNLDDFTNTHIEILGSEHNYGPMSNLLRGCREAVLWLAAHHADKRAVGLLAREVAPAGTGMAPGLTGIVGGRPKPSPVSKLFSYLHPKDQLQIDININGQQKEKYTPPTVPTAELDKGVNKAEHSGDESESSTDETELIRGDYYYKLEDLAYTRSGDKGNNANIGVIARHEAILPYLRERLTEEAVAQYFSHVFNGQTGPNGKFVQRYEVPGVHALNFVLYNSLGGGGTASLRSDPQGKAYGQMLLDFKLRDMPDFSQLLQ